MAGGMGLDVTGGKAVTLVARAAFRNDITFASVSIWPLKTLVLGCGRWPGKSVHAAVPDLAGLEIAQAHPGHHFPARMQLVTTVL